jgi:hypothetical protein
MPGRGATGAPAAGVPLTDIRGRWFGELLIFLFCEQLHASTIATDNSFHDHSALGHHHNCR